MKMINWKVLRKFHLLASLKDLQTTYFIAPHFNDVNLYLLYNKLSVYKAAIWRLDAVSQRYMTLDTLPFKVVNDHIGEYAAPLYIYCQSRYAFQPLPFSFIAGYAGLTEFHMKICQRFYCPSLANHIIIYITGCHICQRFKRTGSSIGHFRKEWIAIHKLQISIDVNTWLVQQKT